MFFIRDGYQFPEMVHALRANPKNNIQEGWRILDWFSAHPEGINLFTYLLGDEGIPRNWRTCDGFGVNTFIMYKGDREVYVKFNWKSLAEGPQYMNDDEAQNAGMHTPVKHRSHLLYFNNLIFSLQSQLVIELLYYTVKQFMPALPLARKDLTDY